MANLSPKGEHSETSKHSLLKWIVCLCQMLNCNDQAIVGSSAWLQRLGHLIPMLHPENPPRYMDRAYCELIMLGTRISKEAQRVWLLPCPHDPNFACKSSEMSIQFLCIGGSAF